MQYMLFLSKNIYFISMQDMMIDLGTETRTNFSKYESTHETTNHVRITRMILGPCTDLLRDVLRNEKQPHALS